MGRPSGLEIGYLFLDLLDEFGIHSNPAIPVIRFKHTAFVTGGFRFIFLLPDGIGRLGDIMGIGYPPIFMLLQGGGGENRPKAALDWWLTGKYGAGRVTADNNGERPPS